MGQGSDSGRRSCTLPGLSYSSNLITTDVPLILFWTVALYAWIMLVQRRSIGFAVFLGVAIGLGLLAKQAMVYAFLCIACQAAVSREAREALKGGRAVVLVSIAVRAECGLQRTTRLSDRQAHRDKYWLALSHIHPLQLIEYLGVQFGVFGPILIVVLARSAWREIRASADPNKILLLSFSLPVLALLAVQALLSRAHGNWSATALPSGIDLGDGRDVRAEQINFVQDFACLAHHRCRRARRDAGLRPAMAGVRAAEFLSGVVGWREAGDTVRTQLAEERYGAILVDTRELAAELLYCLRDVPVPLYVWPSGPVPMHHYEMTRPFTASTP